MITIDRVQFIGCVLTRVENQAALKREQVGSEEDVIEPARRVARADGVFVSTDTNRSRIRKSRRFEGRDRLVRAAITWKLIADLVAAPVWALPGIFRLVEVPCEHRGRRGIPLEPSADRRTIHIRLRLPTFCVRRRIERLQVRGKDPEIVGSGKIDERHRQPPQGRKTAACVRVGAGRQKGKARDDGVRTKTVVDGANIDEKIAPFRRVLAKNGQLVPHKTYQIRARECRTEAGVPPEFVNCPDIRIEIIDDLCECGLGIALGIRPADIAVDVVIEHSHDRRGRRRQGGAEECEQEENDAR